MPRQEYRKEFIVDLYPLNLNSQLRYRINTERGHVTGFVVQLEVEIDERLYAVVRYDCAHGQPHRDILNAAGHVIDKQWLSFEYETALNQADSDLRENWRHYREEFIRGMA